MHGDSQLFTDLHCALQRLKLWRDIIKLFTINSFFSWLYKWLEFHTYFPSFSPHLTTACVHALKEHDSAALLLPAWFRGDTQNGGNWIFFLMCHNIPWQLKKKKKSRLNRNASARNYRITEITQYHQAFSVIYFFAALVSLFHLQQTCIYACDICRMMCPSHLKTPFQQPLVPRWKTIMIPLLLGISQRTFRGGLICDSLWEVQGKGNHGPQQTEHPRVYSQQAAPGYILSWQNKSFPTRALANCKYFMCIHCNKRFQQESWHRDIYVYWSESFLYLLIVKLKKSDKKCTIIMLLIELKQNPLERSLSTKAVPWSQEQRGLVHWVGLQRRTLCFQYWLSQI